MVRTAQYKFIKSDKKHERRGGETELYDLTEDPLETNNLAKDPAYAGTLKELSAQIEAWQKDIPPVPVVEGLKPQASGDGSAPGEKQKKTDRKRKPALPS